MASKLSENVFMFFFASHIPATIIVDMQVVFPKKYFPAFARRSFDFYIETFKDPLLTNKPLWFRSLVMAEVVFQLPFFFIALYAFKTRANWIRIPSIMYAAHACTQMVPILGSVWFDEAVPQGKRTLLASIYLPYFAIPFWLLVHMYRNPVPFPLAIKNE